MGPDRIRLLLDDLGWLRTLARRLARDPEVADDLVQDACAIALRQAHSPESWRAWLTTVVQNLLAARRRGDHRRSRLQPLVEADVAVDEHSAVQRAADQQRLAAAVMQLDEPYRSTVLLRFFDGLPPRRIARQQGVPVATVHSRLQRAMQQLRGRLDRDYGGRASWMVAFAAVGWSVGVATATRRAAGVAVFVGACVLLLAAGAWWWRSAPAPAPAPADVVVAAALLPEARNAARVPVEDVRVWPPVEPAEVAHVGPRPQQLVRGRVVDCEGAPVAAVPISAAAGASPQGVRPENLAKAFATSDANGDFVGKLPWTQAFLVAFRPDLECVWISNWSLQSPVAPIVVVAPRLQVGGVLVTAGGDRVPGGRVWLELPRELAARVGGRLDRVWDTSWSVPIDGQGRFQFDVLPAVRGARLCFAAPRGSGAVDAPLASTDQLRLELPAEAVARGPGGVVLRTDGSPAPDARVVMAGQVVHADCDGRFVFPVDAPIEHLMAALPKVGWGELTADAVAAGVAGGSPLVVVLASPPGVASGRVVDPAGQPIAAAEVWLAEPTPFGADGHIAVHLEYFLAGGSAGGFRLESLRDAVAQARPGGASWVHLDHATPLWYFAVADADGRFQLPGLLDRRYPLIAFDRSSGCFGTVLDVRDGDTTAIVVRRHDVWPEVKGRLVSRTGEPVQGARVSQKIVPFQCHVDRPQGRFHWSALREGRRADSDAEGRFVLREVGRRATYLLVEGDEIVPLRLDPEQLLRMGDVPIEVSFRCAIELVLADATEADRCRCEASDGSSAAMLVVHQNSSAFCDEVQLHGGRSGVFSIGEDAAQLRLLRGGATVRLVPIVPRRGELLLVQ